VPDAFLDSEACSASINANADANLARIPKLNLGLPGQLVESELPALITSRTERVFGFFGSNPSPVPHRLMTTPAVGHPLPKGEGRHR
jgi:hypothetical protein